MASEDGESSIAEFQKTTDDTKGLKKGKNKQLKDDSDGDSSSIAESMGENKLELQPPPKKNKNQDLPKQKTKSEELLFPHNYPKIRFMQWNKLSSQTNEILVESLGYNQGSWDTGGWNSVEERCFTVVEPDGARLLGMNKGVWDCFINRE